MKLFSKQMEHTNSSINPILMTDRNVSSSSLDGTTEKEHKCLTSEVGRKTITGNDTGDALLCGTCSKMFSSLDNFNRHTFLVSECQALLFPEIDPFYKRQYQYKVS